MDNTVLNKRSIAFDINGPVDRQVLVDINAFGGGGFSFVRIHCHDFQIKAEAATNINFRIGDLSIYNIDADQANNYTGTGVDLFNNDGGNLSISIRDNVRVYGTIWYSMK